jgi:glycosyltransferase involved in cell wall biosynthesis
MDGPPLVSVIIPAYNEEKYIGRCLATLQRQTLAPDQREIIVVDDGSTDQTRAVVARYGVTVLRQAHRGPALARNLGASLARGAILVFLDADMSFAPTFLARLIAPILERGAVGTFTRDEYVRNTAQAWARYVSLSSGLPPDRRMPADFGDTCSVFRAIRREAFAQVGGYTDMGTGEDSTLAHKLGLLAVRAEGAVCYHDNPATVRDVFQAARWYARSATAPHDWPSLVRLLPPVALLRALRAGVRHGAWSFVAFQLVQDSGRLAGRIDRDLLRRHHAK